MIVVWSDHRQRFEAVTSFVEKNIPKENRWRWDPAVKRWWAPSEDIARRLARFAQGPAALRLVDMADGERAALAASQAEDSDLVIPAPPGLDYLPYQRASIAYALSVFGDLPPSPRSGQEGGLALPRRGVLIADEMGL